MEGNEQLAVIIPMLKKVGAGIVVGQLGGRRRARRSVSRGCSIT
ncbi:MAG: hypothetical protein ABI862_20170 [Ilumatobacteraceae bacterium]